MYGDQATALVHHLYKSSSLPPYKEDAVRQVVQEIDQLYAQLEEQLYSFIESFFVISDVFLHTYFIGFIDCAIVDIS